ncbi:hypothetical protein BB934_27665 (plasmid) [Microvirga ossetica]|uniref:Uncharacterized protein n=1 Tax=Microvirga ossetica TaxID=1882682 RepID=A0A1B2EQA9_9HYPH|nr:hypothetical protein BB934_27665 [Microvirga ossetica]
MPEVDADDVCPAGRRPIDLTDDAGPAAMGVLREVAGLEPWPWLRAYRRNGHGSSTSKEIMRLMPHAPIHPLPQVERAFGEVVLTSSASGKCKAKVSEITGQPVSD